MGAVLCVYARARARERVRARATARKRARLRACATCERGAGPDSLRARARVSALRFSQIYKREKHSLQRRAVEFNLCKFCARSRPRARPARATTGLGDYLSRHG